MGPGPTRRRYLISAFRVAHSEFDFTNNSLGQLFSEQYNNSQAIHPLKRLHFTKPSQTNSEDSEISKKKHELIYTLNAQQITTFHTAFRRSLITFSPIFYYTLHTLLHYTPSLLTSPVFQSTYFGVLFASLAWKVAVETHDNGVLRGLVVEKGFEKVHFVLEHNRWAVGKGAIQGKAISGVLDDDVVDEIAQSLGKSATVVSVPREDLIWVGWEQEWRFLMRNRWIEMLQKEDSVYDPAETVFETTYAQKNPETFVPELRVVFYHEPSNRIYKLKWYPY